MQTQSEARRYAQQFLWTARDVVDRHILDYLKRISQLSHSGMDTPLEEVLTCTVTPSVSAVLGRLATSVTAEC